MTSIGRRKDFSRKLLTKFVNRDYKRERRLETVVENHGLTNEPEKLNFRSLSGARKSSPPGSIFRPRVFQPLSVSLSNRPCPAERTEIQRGRQGEYPGTRELRNQERGCDGQSVRRAWVTPARESSQHRCQGRNLVSDAIRRRTVNSSGLVVTKARLPRGCSALQPTGIYHA